MSKSKAVRLQQGVENLKYDFSFLCPLGTWGLLKEMWKSRVRQDVQMLFRGSLSLLISERRNGQESKRIDRAKKLYSV